MKKIPLLLLLFLFIQIQNINAQEYDDIDFEEFVDDVPPASIDYGVMLLGAVGFVFAIKKLNSKIK
jgi:hypothetical protein